MLISKKYLDGYTVDMTGWPVGIYLGYSFNRHAYSKNEYIIEKSLGI